MSDISTGWNVDTLQADWFAGNGDLLSGDDLQSAIMISLFTDRLARSDDDVDGGHRRGWWGDTGSDEHIGSRLWLLKRKKLTVQVARFAESYASEALNWMVTDGVVSHIDVLTQIVWPQRLNMVIRYQRPGRGSEDLRFYWVWEVS